MCSIDVAPRDQRSGPGKFGCAASRALATKRCNGAPLSISQETTMKRIIQGLFLAALVSAVQPSQASAFPASGDETSVPVAWTYADRHAGEINQSVGSAFPASGDETSVPVAST